MIITNTKIITWGKPNQILEGKALRIADGKIATIGDAAEIQRRYPGEEVLDSGGQYVIPGNICAHTHFYGAFSRGMAIHDPRRRTLWKFCRAYGGNSTKRWMQRALNIRH